PGGTARDLGAIAQHNVSRSEEREVIRNRGAYRAGAGNDDSSHASSSARSSSVSVRNGRRTSGLIGTPRRPSTVFSADWNGKRSIASHTGARSPDEASRTTAATTSRTLDTSAH